MRRTTGSMTLVLAILAAASGCEKTPPDPGYDLVAEAADLDRQGQWMEARAPLKLHLVVNPHDCAGHYYLGRSYSLSESPWLDVARGEFQVASVLFDPGEDASPVARFDGLGFQMALQFELARVIRRQTDMLHALGGRPEHVDEMLEAWTQASAKGRKPAPERVRDVLLKLDPPNQQPESAPPDGQTFLEYGEYLCREQRWKEAQEILNLHVLAYPGDAAAHYYLGRCHFVLQELGPETAYGKYRLALELFNRQGKESPIDRFSGEYFEMICYVDMAKADLLAIQAMLGRGGGGTPGLMRAHFERAEKSLEGAKEVAPDRQEVQQLEELLRDVGAVLPEVERRRGPRGPFPPMPPRPDQGPPLPAPQEAPDPQVWTV